MSVQSCESTNEISRPQTIKRVNRDCGKLEEPRSFVECIETLIGKIKFKSPFKKKNCHPKNVKSFIVHFNHQQKRTFVKYKTGTDNIVVIFSIKYL